MENDFTLLCFKTISTNETYAIILLAGSVTNCVYQIIITKVQLGKRFSPIDQMMSLKAH